MSKGTRKKIIPDLPLNVRIFLSFVLITLLPAAVLGFCHLFLQSIPLYVLLTLSLPIAAGWWIVSDVFKAVSLIVTRTRHSLADIGAVLEGGTVDEMNFLQSAFDRMSLRVRTSFDELSKISKTSEKVNEDVVRNVTLLSAVIKLNELVSMGSDVQAVLEFIVARLREILSLDVSFLLLDDKGKGFFSCKVMDSLKRLDFEGVDSGAAFLVPLMKDRDMIIVDGQHSYRPDFQEFFRTHTEVRNCLLAPVVLDNEVLGVLGCGNDRPGYAFSAKDVETVEFFIRYVVLMMEQNRRAVQPKETDIKDALSGLYTAQFMADRLEEELRNSRRDQKPCGFVLVKLRKFRDVLQKNGILSIEASLKKIARIIEDNLEAGEKAARCGEDTFGIIMPRVNKPKLEVAARELLGKIQSDLYEDARELDVAVSFAENPIDGVTVDELVAHATIALQQTTERHAA